MNTIPETPRQRIALHLRCIARHVAGILREIDPFAVAIAAVIASPASAAAVALILHS